jgi:hypothetical protein
MIEGALLDHGIEPQDHIDFEPAPADDGAAFKVTCKAGIFVVTITPYHVTLETVKEHVSALKKGA